MVCEHSDCFTCPYPDCIVDMKPSERPAPKRTPLQETRHRYYLAHREEYIARAKERNDRIRRRKGKE